MGSIDWESVGPLLREAAGQTAYMVLVTLLVGGVVGLAIGLGLYLTRAGNLLGNRVAFTILNVLINLIRPVPFIIFLVALGPLTRVVTGRTIGIEAFTFAMCVMASVVFARLVEQNLVGIDPGVVEAARAMGASPLRIIRTVLVPEALAPLILGYTFLFIGVLDMSAMAGYIGGGGLGNFAIAYGYQKFDQTVTWTAVIIMIVLVQVVQGVANAIAKHLLKR